MITISSIASLGAACTGMKAGRAALAHRNLGDKGDRVRLRYADTIALNTGGR